MPKRRKLTEEQVIELVNDTTSKRKELAIKYGLCEHSITKIRSGRVYKDVFKKHNIAPCPMRKRSLTKEQVFEILDIIEDFEKRDIPFTSFYNIGRAKAYKDWAREWERKK